MSVQERIRVCRLLELMAQQKDYSKKLELENSSRFQGKQIEKEGRAL